MKIIIKHLFILLFLGLIPCGCDNDPASPAEEHTDTDGFILEDESGIEIYREFEGASTGSVTIGFGQPLALSVHFLNHEGIEIEHEEGEEDHEDELKITVINTDIAIVEVNEHCDEITDQTACETAEHCEWHADEAACEDEEHDDPREGLGQLRGLRALEEHPEAVPEGPLGAVLVEDGAGVRVLLHPVVGLRSTERQ